MRGRCAVLVVALLAGCAQLPPRPFLPDVAAIEPTQATQLDQLTAPLEAEHPGQSAFRLVVEGTEAFVSRVQSARLAERSLDVQSYIWHMDLTGSYFVQELLLAADRGVRVRVLLDDMDARNENATFAALAAHPSIEVRTFNPFASRNGAMRFIAEATTSFERINRRMHNKSWIADNRIAIVGGRNIGDEYFGASDEVNFVDLDFAMVGPVVRQASAAFDAYWNSPSSYPMEALDPQGVTADALNRLRDALRSRTVRSEQSRYAQALRADDAIKRMVAGEWPMQWSDTYRFVADDPLKVTMKARDAQRTHVGATLVPLVEGAQQRLSIISPYFVPGAEVTAALANMVGGGKDVRILTNSLAANDVAAVHGGYARHRQDLLEGGVQVWELKPLPGTQESSSLRVIGSEPAHQGVCRRWPRALRRQLQPRSALDLVELRAGSVRAQRAARSAARADLRQTDSGGTRVARFAERGRVALDRWSRNPRPRASCFVGASLPGVARAYATARRAVVIPAVPSSCARRSRTATHCRLLSNSSCARNAACYSSRRSKSRGSTAASIAESEMFSIYGTAMQSTQREHNRAARGCPSILNIETGSWSRLATELDR